MKNKIFPVMLAVMLLITVLPVSAVWYEGDLSDDNGFIYEYSGSGEVELVGYYGEAVEELIVPESVDGYPVTGMADYVFDYSNRNLYYGKYDFAIKKITLPETITRIGSRAFGALENLREINIPDSVETVGKKAFYPGLYENDDLWENGGLYIDSVLVAVSSKCEGSFYVREGTRAIASYSFSGSGVTDVVIPDSVYNLYANAFADSEVTAVNIPLGVKKINNSAFSNSKISDLSIPDSVEAIGDFAFANSFLTSVSIESEHLTSGKDVFSGCNGLESITAPVSFIRRLRKSALRNSVRSITLTGDEPIDDYMFYGFNNLEEINISGGIESIGNHAFSGCENLRIVSLPSTLTNIGYRSFADCAGLTEINLPDNVKIIGDEAFSGCSALGNITIPDSTERIGYGALHNTKIYNDAENWENGALYIGDVLLEANEEIGNIYSVYDGTRLIANRAFSNISGVNCLNIPDSVKDIGFGAFKNCTSLRRVVMSNNVSGIGYETFMGCESLNSVNVPVGTEYIGAYAFSGCTELSEIKIPKTVTDIGEYAFSGCGLKKITIPGSAENIGNSAFSGCYDLESVNMSDGLKDIEAFAFFNCINLERISVPESIRKVGNQAFECCDGLNSVTYYGTAEKWGKVTLGYGNDALDVRKINYAAGAPVTEIVLNKTELKLDAGESATLTAKVLPDNATDKTVSWSTSDSGVATVENGVVTAVSAGSAVITAESADGSVTAECAVTVSAVIDADTPVIKAKSARGTAGKTVRVEISVKNNPGMWGLDAVLNYDKSVMTLKDVENGTVFDDSAFTKGNLESDSYILSYENPDIADVTDDGVLAVLIFEIKDTAEKGNYPVTLKYAPGDIINSDEKMVDFCIVNGGVEVTDVIYGDVTGDGVVNKMDALRLKKYLAGLDVEIDLAAADVNCDGVVNKMDALRLKKYLAGQDVKLGE